MKKQLSIVLCGLLSLTQVIFAQTDDDPVALEIAGEKITKSEFVKSFKQANNINPSAAPTACTYEKRKALEDYVELYTNFRLKLHDAYANKYDTSAALNNEYKIYRNEMAMPYLIDSASLQSLLRQTYERNKYVVRASHIMVKVSPNATPKDTLEAYNKAMDIYKRVIAGEDFASLAEELSDDQSARKSVDERGMQHDGNRGDVAYFTVFDMVHEFENAVYSMKTGDISKPVRSKFGYHIIKKTGMEKVYGKVSLQQIWIRPNLTNPEIAEKRANDIYAQLQAGADFSDMVRKYSAGMDKNDSVPGLVKSTPVQFSYVGYVPEIAKLKAGEYSKPFSSEFGWHIIKIVSKEEIPAFEDMEEFYKSKITTAQYGNIPQTKFIENCKKSYKFTDNAAKNKKLTESVAGLLNDSVFMGVWKYSGNLKSDEVLFSSNGKDFTQADFARFIEKSQKYEKIYDYGVYVNNKYNDFVNQKILQQADSLLELNNTEFRNTMREFRNGLVIFAYNDALIWHKASDDTAGLRRFYERESVKHDINDPAQSMYFWDYRARIVDIFINDSVCLKPSKAIRTIRKLAIDEGKTPSEINDALTPKLSRKCKEEHPIGYASRTIEQKNSKAPDGNSWKVGVYATPRTKGYRVQCVTQLLDPTRKSLGAARGYYINDYQNELERDLIKSLREKYKVVVNQDVIDSITW